MQESLNSELSRLPQETPTAQMERERLQREHNSSLKLLEDSLFKRPEVPNWLNDDISMCCMHDPVIVSSKFPNVTKSIKKTWGKLTDLGFLWKD